jgi:DNA-binding transcriptional MocR family regulator
LVPLGVKAATPSTGVMGGYFVWITLPAPLRATDIVERAQKEQNLCLAGGDLFRVADETSGPADRFGDKLRLCFAWEEPRHLTEGVRRLARVLQMAL